MSAVGRSVRSIGCSLSFRSLLAVLALTVTGLAHADSVAPKVPSPDVDASPESAKLSAPARHDGKPTMEELREHASTITDILDLASKRVERLAAADAGTPALVEAIRQELSLTRRWNAHLSTILLDVAEARRALGERERLAAKEVARMTAVAEEARRELVELKEVLKRPSDESVRRAPGKGAQRLEGRTLAGLADAPLADIDIGGLAGSEGDLQAVRSTLASVKQAEQSAKRDVDAVRGKIIEVLQTLAARHGFQPTDEGGDGLSSADITSWAASMAVRLSRPDLPD